MHTKQSSGQVVGALGVLPMVACYLQQQMPYCTLSATQSSAALGAGLACCRWIPLATAGSSMQLGVVVAWAWPRLASESPKLW